ncbi:MAG: HD domain-containing protein, partial [Nitrospirota bacterium]|nr:HD domain-containing protein [Nitrospirota bacterium]
MKNISPTAVGTALTIPRTLVSSLLNLYDYPHPSKSGMVIRGYDKSHALRTAKMCIAVARDLEHPADRVEDYQIACLLHDLGRAGLETKLFGAIWSWARAHGIPTRPAEWRALHQKTAYGKETAAFISLYRTRLEQSGITMHKWACEQVEMRLGFARRMRRQLRRVKPTLKNLNINWKPWMSKVTLYYYYPEKLANGAPWVRELGEILVACEQLEAYSNRRRGKDYYTRGQESFAHAFQYLDRLVANGQLSGNVVKRVKVLTRSEEHT